VQQRRASRADLALDEAFPRGAGVYEQLDEPAVVAHRLAERGWRPVEEHHEIEVGRRRAVFGAGAAGEQRAAGVEEAAVRDGSGPDDVVTASSGYGSRDHAMSQSRR
jgi:hypothetical protein